jgi:LacI family transcriptional regulator
MTGEMDLGQLRGSSSGPARRADGPTGPRLRGVRADAAARARALEQEPAATPYQIGIVFDVWRDLEFEHPFFGPALTGAKERAWAHGADLVLLQPFPRRPVSSEPLIPENADWYVQRVRAFGLAGVITFGTVAFWPEIQGLVAAEIPCVAIDDYLLGVRASHVSSDNVDGGRQAVAHLLSVGRRRIGILTGSAQSAVSGDRRRGWETELERAGLHADAELCVECGWLEERARDGMRRLLSLPEPVDAVFAQSDDMAVGAMRAIAEAGLRVPEDVAVVGFDDSQLAEMTDPPLTSVRQDPVGLGLAAAEVLLQMVEHPDEPVAVAVVPVELIVRASTATSLAAPADAADADSPPDEGD